MDDDNVPADMSGGVPVRAATRPQQNAPRSEQRPQPQTRPNAPAQPASGPQQGNGKAQRLSPKQLGLIWALAKRLGYEEGTFRQHVSARFGNQPEGLDARTASTLIGQLTAKASNGASHPAGRCVDMIAGIGIISDMS